MTNLTEPTKAKRPVVIWIAAVPILLIATTTLAFSVQGLIRAPDFAASHPISMVLLPVGKICLLAGTATGLFLRFRPARWLAACLYLGTIVMSIHLFFTLDPRSRTHHVADLAEVRHDDPAYLWGYDVGELLGCLTFVTFAAWIIYRLLFHSSMLLYFGVKKRQPAAPALTTPPAPPPL